MAATAATNLTSGANNTSQTSQATASVSIPAYSLILLAAFNRVASGTPNEPTVSGASCTWTKVDTVTTGQMRLTVFRAMSTVATSGVLTIDYGGQTATSSNWSVDAFDHVDTTGTNGANAVVQAVTDTAVGTTTGESITLSAFGSADNSTYGVIVNDNTVAVTVGSGFTQLSNQVSNHRIVAEWKVSNDTTVDWTWSSTSLTDYGVAVEIKNGEPPSSSFFALL